MALLNSQNSVSDEEECKWEYFRKLKNSDHDHVNDESLRKFIGSAFDETQSSILSDEMNAMERTLKLQTLRDELSDNIVDKIDDPKERMLVALLYKVCNDMDPTRIQFVKFSILLHQHGILTNLNFLINDNLNVNINYKPLTIHNDGNNDDDDGDDEDDEWDESEPESVENTEDLFKDKFGDLHHGHFDDQHNDNNYNYNDNDDENDNYDENDDDVDDFHDDEEEEEEEEEDNNDDNHGDLPLIRSMSFKRDNIENDNDDSNNTKNKNKNINSKSMPAMIPLSTPTKSIRSATMNQMTSRYHRDFEELEIIGFGAFGTVHKVKHKLDSNIYAIKKILYKHSALNHDSIKKEIIREVTNIATLSHENIVRYFTAWIEPVITTKNDNMITTTKAIQNKPIKPIKPNTNNTKIISFFDYHHQHQHQHEYNEYNEYEEEGMYLKPTGSIPINRNISSNEELSVLLSSDAQKSLISPYPSRHTSPTPNGYRSPVKLINDDEHKNEIKEIVNYWQNQTSYSCLFMQCEYCGHYTLCDYINDKKRIPDRNDNMHLFSQLLLGLSHIHSKLLLHRDLKPENVFLINKQNPINISDPQQLTAKIGDFGLSKSIQDTLIDTHSHYEFDNTNLNINDFAHQSSGNLTANTGTEVYAAPEQLLSDTNTNNNIYGTAADIYSLGIILFELIQPAFDTQMERRTAISNFRRDHYIDPYRVNLQKFDTEIELMISMTSLNPSQRPTAHHLISNNYFIRCYWMQNVLNNAMPDPPPNFTSNTNEQRSLEYNQCEVSVITPPSSPPDNNNLNNNNLNGDNGDSSSHSLQSMHSLHNQSNQSPMFLVSSPSTGAGTNGFVLDHTNNNNKDNNK